MQASRNEPRINGQKKKNKNVNKNCNDELEVTDGGENGRSSSSCSPEDDCNGSQELNGVENSESKGSASVNSNSKARASRGSATDPQSLYARVHTFKSLPDLNKFICIFKGSKRLSNMISSNFAEKKRKDK